MRKTVILESLAFVILILCVFKFKDSPGSRDDITKAKPANPDAADFDNSSVIYYVDNHEQARRHLQECRNTPPIKDTARCVNAEFAAKLIGINH